MTLMDIAIILLTAVASLLALGLISQWLDLEPSEQTEEDIQDRQW